ncbi:hypothetical protein [Sinorhizobium americanum]|uniref:hypothetical protein n=1 Tax=Sinorhizobium americanum TaxID=194963 RepID=UPI001404ED29|nr:hypothetical protein [Sinorhizobium americanum]
MVALDSARATNRSSLRLGSPQQSKTIILVVDVPRDEMAAHLNLSPRRTLVHLCPAGALRHCAVEFGGREQHFGVLRRTTDDQGMGFRVMTIDLLDRQLFLLCLPHCCRSSQEFDGQR